MGKKDGYTQTKLIDDLPVTIHFDGEDKKIYSETLCENGDIGIIYYDEKGQVDREQLLDSDKNVKSITDVTSFDSGKCEFRRTVFMDGRQDRFEFSQKNFWFPDGTPVRRELTPIGDIDGGDGNITEQFIFTDTEEREVPDTAIFSFDKENNLEHFVFSEGEHTVINDYDFWENGNVRTIEKTDYSKQKDGQLIKSQVKGFMPSSTSGTYFFYYRDEQGDLKEVEVVEYGEMDYGTIENRYFASPDGIPIRIEKFETIYDDGEYEVRTIIEAEDFSDMEKNTFEEMFEDVLDIILDSENEEIESDNEYEYDYNDKDN